ncbi:hypothetical protein [Sphingomonas immobilis]|uniref:Uncharacterized protein n=1 Tax=Sphingomonas immobilis TaxID=3063997 RepID=A0ABT8ZZE5_9SPHN|nr:hypothetical protein [Sphingomonas sp. CA1-15]MDO7842952.1 hypothetical protein [Sphingomonas sp. CA1-15]
MTQDKKPTATLTRSAKLRQQAGNCLTIAVREKTPDFAAELIDEALRLSQRAAELEGKAA